MLIDFTQEQLRDLQTLVLGDVATANQRIPLASRLALAVLLHAAMSNIVEEAVEQARTHLINIMSCEICESVVAQGVSADWYGRPLGTDRGTVGVVGAGLASFAARGQARPSLA